ncbi:MAG: GspH/FimT family protein [Deltaproteobacteria bacterium]|nr:GspH/FimT family protein [Deltaproteobacteria bacterium]MBW2042795.1 GspH/FimT family protein [Deltaproteobacteria bacterium]
MRKDAGITLAEVMVVIAIVGILMAIAVPNWLSWRAKAKINGALTNLRGDIEMTKLRAIRENAHVTILFSSDAYTVFIDNGAGGGTASNWVRDGGEILLKNRQLAAGVRINMGATTFPVRPTGSTTKGLRFNGRARPSSLGTVVLADTRGEIRKIVVNLPGRARIVY